MAKQPGYQNRSTQSGTSELKRRLLFVLGALIVFRIGSFIPVPGIDSAVLAQVIEQQKGTIVDMFNMFSGGALSRASVFALGIMPYISASIIIQLLTSVYPALAELKKEGEAGRRKISKYTRYSTLALATIQAIGISTIRSFTRLIFAMVEIMLISLLSLTFASFRRSITGGSIPAVFPARYLFCCVKSGELSLQKKTLSLIEIKLNRPEGKESHNTVITFLFCSKEARMSLLVTFPV